ncbi:response regulator transcription factor [Lentibacillus saliphilus]|uniref:response regulator transcription factor n=1 Tax=Lentibacillus saliphilus TaxID=2737028 RepID=UPI001C3049CF|nr:response regulator transcription factor [Lentibacillus saliphilus]
MYKILLVEDDKALSNGIALALQTNSVEIIQCYDIKSSKTKLSYNTFDLMIFDINLPDGNGMDLLCEVKKVSDTPVIMLTANDMEVDIVAGLEMGADDYITKPFSLAILRARVNTQLRKRSNANAKENTFIQDAFQFDFDKMEFHKNATAIELSKTEQKLLRILVENKGVTLDRSTLIDRIWTDGAEYVDENALSVSIKRLRNKLEDIPSKPQYIKTVYGIGYAWVVT